MHILDKTEQYLCSVPVPAKTDSYTPIPHADFIKNIQDTVQGMGMQITGRYYYANKEGNQLIGQYKLSHEESDLALSIGFKNSYDKSMAAGFALGARVIVCGNGMVSGEFAFRKKHTGTADLEMQEAIVHALDMSKQKFVKLIETKESMKKVIMDKSVINSLIGELYFEKEIIRAEQLSLIKSIYEEPIHDYGVNKDCAWNIYNLCTYAIDQKSHPSLYIGQHGRLLSTFEEKLGISSALDLAPQEFELVD